MQLPFSRFRKSRPDKLSPLAFEALEDRRLLATAALVSTTMQDSAWLLVVRYTDPSGMNIASLGDDDVTVTGPNSYNHPGHFVSFVQDVNGSNASIRAVYSVPSRTGAWNFTDNGTYTLNMLANTVTTANNGAVPASQLATFNLFFSTPKAELISAVTNDTQFVADVKYSDNHGIDPTSIGFGEVGLVPADQPSDVQFFRSQTYSQNSDGSWTVEYRLTARGGSWDWTDTGTYSVVLRGGAVHDNETPQHFIPAQSLGQFYLWFSEPKAQLVTQSLTATDWLITVRFTDNGTLDASSIGDGDIQLNNGVSTVLGQLVSGAPTEGASSITAVYSVRPTHFAWGAAENGTYVVSAREGQVQDTTGVAIHAVELGRFYLWFDTPSISKPVNVNNALPNRWDITVSYTDDTSVNINSVGNGDLRIEGPGGYIQQATLLEKHTAVVNGVTTVVATYRFTPTGSQFANGTYNIFMNANQVTDNAGNAIPGFTWGSFFLFF
jgi:hypothetical protein